MREIKFRAWLPSIKKMTYAHSINELIGWHKINGYTPNIKWLQYVGLKDKNGVEIYEGDIVKISCNGMNENIFVKWDYEAAGFKGYIRKKPDTPKWMLCGSENCMEVISNIYENPELLEAE